MVFAARGTRALDGPEEAIPDRTVARALRGRAARIILLAGLAAAVVSSALFLMRTS